MMAALSRPVSRAAHLWLAQRVSGILLALGLPVHVLRLYFAPQPVTYAWVTGVLSNAGWKAFHVVLLVALVFHSMAGLRSFVLDYRTARRFRQWVDWAVLLVGGGLVLLGLQALFAAPQVR